MQSYYWSMLFFLLSSFYPLLSQEKKITLEDIFEKNIFQMNAFTSLQWKKQPNQYLKMVKQKNGYEISSYNALNDKKVKTILKSSSLVLKADTLPIEIEQFQLSTDEKKILLKTASNAIYRYSSESICYVYDLEKQDLQALSNGKRISHPTFSPHNKKIAYVKHNNLFVFDLETNAELQLTFDGEKNKVINGSSDWVYEEEFELTKAFEWSLDAKTIAFLTFDEADVKEYGLQMWNAGNYPITNFYKYPKAGEKNAKITIKTVDLETKNIQTVLDYCQSDIYVPRFTWTPQTDVLSVFLLNRNQDYLQIIHVNTKTKQTDTVKKINSETYVEISNNFHYLNDNKTLIYTDEKDNFRHLYRLDLKTKSTFQITKGNWEVEDIVAVNEAKKLIYYTSKEVSELEKHFFVVDFDGKNKKRLTFDVGTHEVNINPAQTLFTDLVSSDNGIVVKLIDLNSLKVIRTIEQNASFLEAKKPFKFSNISYFSFKNRDSISLNAWILKPINFDSTKKYPVLQFVYGGPGSQNVAIKWKRIEILWFQLLAQNGYIVACTDNRGTNGRGVAFRNCTTRNLGKLESQDQIDYAIYLAKKGYVDKERMGIFGWSFGGFLSSMCILVGNEIFKMAIAVAPVSSWRYYDSIYTERYMKTPNENAKGYDENSTLFHASKLKGNLLLIHGTGDDNVHIQHTIALQQALIKHNKQFDVFYYPDKNHGISGGNTRLHLFELMTNYIYKHL
jgi:dipeptidyl-peptidase 4